MLSNHLTKGPFTIYELYSIIYIYSSRDILKYTHTYFHVLIKGFTNSHRHHIVEVRNNKCLYH